LSASSAPAPVVTRYRYLLVTALHLLLLAGVVSALYTFGLVQVLPSDSSLLQWDVIWYEQIRATGYAYSATAMSNSAFFPLLPYMWRFTGLGLLGVSLLNLSLFLGSFTWLAYQLRLPARLQLLLLSTPSLMFMVVPYTEALFFCFGTLLLLGLRRRQLSWWLLGLLGCGLTRSASTLFTPPLLFMVLIWATQPGQLRTALVWGATGLLALGASVGMVATLQWKTTGEPWGFILAQKHWGHKIGVPNIPMIDASGIDMLWLDGLAVWLGVVAIGCCCWLAWRWLKSRQQLPGGSPATPPEIVFSLGYCVCVVLFILLYQGGNIWNMARYIFATPFLVMLVAYVASQPAWAWRRYAQVAAATMVLWQIFGIYTRGLDNFSTLEALWYFGLVTAYLLVYLGWRQLRWQREITIVIYVFNLVMLLHFLDGWLQGYVIQ
jgi:hypothetical protein